MLSPSTAGYDRGRKFERYREIALLRDYILVHADSPWVEHFARQEDASWIFREYRGIGGAVPISSLDCLVRLAELYSGVLDFPG